MDTGESSAKACDRKDPATSADEDDNPLSGYKVSSSRPSRLSECLPPR